jgi:hypothetical protein
VLGGDGEPGMQVEAVEVSLHRRAVLGARGLGGAETVQARAGTFAECLAVRD